VAACATGTVAVIEGARMVQQGIVDYCIAGASDASIVPVLLAGYHNMKALSGDRILPFDKRRNGFMVGEGGGIVFLETLESAKARGVKIYGEIQGFAYGSDGTDLIHFQDKEDALKRTLDQLLHRTAMKPSDIDYVNLHGTGTVHGDRYETSQIKKSFGKAAHGMAMSSTKSMTGHMLGASGAVEIIASLIAMDEKFIPPTIHLEKPDPECDLNYTPLKAKPKKIQNAVSISMGFGGHVAVIALRKT
jgi:3-oxoacyl-[acyl-carrier-protein] synthase II